WSKLSRSFVLRHFTEGLGLLRLLFFLVLSMFSVQGQEAFGMFDGRPHDDVTAVGSRHRATYQNDFLRFAHLHDLKILHRYTSIAHVTRHTLIFTNAARRRAIADRADAPARFRTVRDRKSTRLNSSH